MFLVTKLRDRISRLGLISTVLYLLITVVLGRLGIEINFIYKVVLPGSAAHQHDVKILYSLNDISVRCRNTLNRLSGVDLVHQADMEKRFQSGQVLALGFVSGNPVSLSWLALIGDKHKFLCAGDWLILSCLTFPDARGFGFFPRSICALEQIATERWLAGMGTQRLFMEVSITNDASIKGIEKAGLTKESFVIKLCGNVLLKCNLA